MSKEAYTFENINGKTAYLVGVVDTLCDEYLVSACPQYTIVEADLFEIDESQDFNKYIAARLKEYLPSIGGDAGAIEDKINKMKIEFEKETDFKSFQAPGFIMSMYEHMPEYMHGRKGHDAFALFCEGTEYYLGKPIGFYRATKEYDILSKFYIGMIYEVILIEFEGYLLMLSRGTSE